MADFYLDNDVGIQLTDSLSTLGHDVVTTSALGYATARDSLQLLIAMRGERVFVTHNQRDYVLLHEAWLYWSTGWGVVDAPLHGGIVILPQPLPQGIADAIDSFFTEGHRLQSQMYRWRRSDGWSQWQLGSTWLPLRRQ